MECRFAGDALKKEHQKWGLKNIIKGENYELNRSSIRCINKLKKP